MKYLISAEAQVMLVFWQLRKISLNGTLNQLLEPKSVCGIIFADN